MVHQRVHALAGRKCLEGTRQRGNVEYQKAPRGNDRRYIAEVREILQEHGRRLRGHPTKGAALPRQRVAERADRVWLEIAQRIEVDKLQVRGPDVGHPERALLGGGARDHEREHGAQPGAAHPRPHALSGRAEHSGCGRAKRNRRLRGRRLQSATGARAIYYARPRPPDWRPRSPLASQPDSTLYNSSCNQGRASRLGWRPGLPLARLPGSRRRH